LPAFGSIAELRTTTQLERARALSEPASHTTHGDAALSSAAIQRAHQRERRQTRVVAAGAVRVLGRPPVLDSALEIRASHRIGEPLEVVHVEQRLLDRLMQAVNRLEPASDRPAVWLVGIVFLRRHFAQGSRHRAVQVIAAGSESLEPLQTALLQWLLAPEDPSLAWFADRGSRRLE
jgi:hypothetical protein